MTGTTWQVESVHHVVDGDTVRLIRKRQIDLDGRYYFLTDSDLVGVPVRLVWVDTPERGKPGYREATEDLEEWIAHAGDLTVVCYESGGWDRLLGDLLDADGNSASQWLMTERNWPAYVEGK